MAYAEGEEVPHINMLSVFVFCIVGPKKDGDIGVLLIFQRGLGNIYVRGVSSLGIFRKQGNIVAQWDSIGLGFLWGLPFIS